MEESRPSGESFDPTSEVRIIAGVLLRHSARLVTGSSQRKIVSGLCEALTSATPNILLAWTWFGSTDARHIVPQIVAGAAADYANSLVIDETALTKAGPAFRALSGLPSKPSIVSPSSPFEPWRRAATLHGIRSSLALPLCSPVEGLRGILVLYARQPDYFDAVGVSLFESLGELFAALLSAAASRRALQCQANSDALTGLGNRRAAEAIERTLYRRIEASERASVLLIDIDHFKEINDRHGHGTGDRVLREFADFLRRRGRAQDCVMRWGGEEFLICLSGASMADALQTAESIRADVAQARFSDGVVAMTVSIGVAELDVGMPLLASVEMADVALYAAKRSGRNRIFGGSPPRAATSQWGDRLADA